MTDFLKVESEKIEILFKMMHEAQNFFVFFSLMAKFEKRWSSNMIMLESSDRGAGGTRSDPPLAVPLVVSLVLIL